MYKDILLQLSTEDLNENVNRLMLAVDDLRYCLDSLNEEKDELVSSNYMYKETLSNLLQKPSKKLSNSIIRSFKSVWNGPTNHLKEAIKNIIDDPISEKDPFIKNPLSPRLKFLRVNPFFDDQTLENTTDISQRLNQSLKLNKNDQEKIEITYIPKAKSVSRFK